MKSFFNKFVVNETIEDDVDDDDDLYCKPDPSWNFTGPFYIQILFVSKKV